MAECRCSARERNALLFFDSDASCTYVDLSFACRSFLCAVDDRVDRLKISAKGKRFRRKQCRAALQWPLRGMGSVLLSSSARTERFSRGVWSLGKSGVTKVAVGFPAPGEVKTPVEILDLAMLWMS